MTIRKGKVEIKDLDIKTASFNITSKSPLIIHKWSEKARREMLDSQQGKKITKKEFRNPEQEFLASIYFIGEQPKDINEFTIGNWRYGFPAIAFKKAMASAAYRLGISKDKVSILGSMFIKGVENDLVEIKCNKIEMVEDMVKIGNGSSDLRYRPYFYDWSAVLVIEYNATILIPEQIATYIRGAGFAVGVGDWRVEKGGQYGMFDLVENK